MSTPINTAYNNHINNTFLIVYKLLTSTNQLFINHTTGQASNYILLINSYENTAKCVTIVSARAEDTDKITYRNLIESDGFTYSKSGLSLIVKSNISSHVRIYAIIPSMYKDYISFSNN